MLQTVTHAWRIFDMHEGVIGCGHGVLRASLCKCVFYGSLRALLPSGCASYNTMCSYTCPLTELFDLSCWWCDLSRKLVSLWYIWNVWLKLFLTTHTLHKILNEEAEYKGATPRAFCERGQIKFVRIPSCFLPPILQWRKAALKASFVPRLFWEQRRKKSLVGWYTPIAHALNIDTCFAVMMLFSSCRVHGDVDAIERRREN